MPKFLDLTREWQDKIKRRLDLAAKVEALTEEFSAAVAAEDAAERRLSAALHLLGTPIVDGEAVYRLEGVGRRLCVVRTPIKYAYETHVPELPADLAELEADREAAFEAALETAVGEPSRNGDVVHWPDGAA